MRDKGHGQADKTGVLILIGSIPRIPRMRSLSSQQQAQRPVHGRFYPVWQVRLVLTFQPGQILLPALRGDAQRRAFYISFSVQLRSP